MGTTPSAVAEALVRRLAAGAPEPEEVKEHFRCLDALAADGAPPEECLRALDVLLEAGEAAGVLGRGHLIIAANVHAQFGSVALAAATIVRAYRSRPHGFTPAHPAQCLRRIRRYGPAAVAEFVAELRAAGVPVALERDSAAVVGGLETARTAEDLTAAVDALRAGGGFPDVVAAGRALSVLRSASGRSAEHAVDLFRLARDTCGLSPRLVNDALLVLAELGAAEQSAEVLADARAAGLEPSGAHLIAHMAALNNALRYDEAEAAYRQYLDAGFPATARARRTGLTSLCWSERPDRVRAALLDWADACRSDEVEAPAPGLLTTAINTLALDDTGDMVALVERTADVFEWNDTHRRLVLGATRRSRALVDHARALATFAVDRPATPAELEALLALSAEQHADDVAAALGLVAGADPAARPVLAGALAVAQLACGDRAAAETTARTSGDPEVAAAVTIAHLDAGDIDGALDAALLLEPDDDEPAGKLRSRRPMPHPPALVGRMTRALAARRGTAAAEEWLRRYAQAVWPAEAWEALASAYRKDRGNVSGIEWLMERMRRVGGQPSGDVWAQWLYALPRAKRAARIPDALTAMQADKVRPTASFFTAAIIGALQPAKVSGATGAEAEAAAWENARAAMLAGEQLLLEAVGSLLRDGAPGSDGWFRPGQLLEIARAYPLSRRPYAQVDRAVEVRMAEETDAEEQFAAFLGAVAAAHARALLPEGVERLRAVAELVGLAGSPELAAAMLDSLSGHPERIEAAVLAEFHAGTVSSALVAEAVGEALACTGTVAAVERFLDAVGPALAEDAAERLLSAAVLAFDDAGRAEEARRLGALGERRGIDLTAAAQGALLATSRPADPGVEDAGPVWTTDQLAAYNGLLQHEFANQLQISRSSTQTLAVAVRRLREKLPAEVLDGAGRYLTALDDIEAALRANQDAQQKSIEKISAAAELERTSAGTVPVLEAMTSVAAQLADEAAEQSTGIRILDREEAALLAVRGHATLLSFALHNLVSNGIKAHRRRGDGAPREIELLATFAESDREDLSVAPYGWVIVSVRDHGDGVPDDLPDNVASWSIPGQPGQGAGIGLRRTEHMIRGSGGRLWIDLSVTEGSRFCFRLPSAARRSARASRPASREDSDHA